MFDCDYVDRIYQVTTEPSAVAPDAGINLCPKQIAHGFRGTLYLADFTDVDSSIRRYRARFCSE